MLDREFSKTYMVDLLEFVARERASGVPIFPPSSSVFRALQLTPLNDVRVVIIGQDPYHGPGQANGLAFSVADHIPLPPSLRNIFREIQLTPQSGNLERWSSQGVLLLNTTLTVRAGRPGSHVGQGWERFTDAVVQILNGRGDPVIFLLWGRHAQAKGAKINSAHHHVLKTAHPSPLSARKGFFGCEHFATTNRLLTQLGHPVIDWS